MKLKCIGGKLDGSIHEIDDSYKVRDYVNLPLRMQITLADLNKSIEEVLDTPPVANYVLYEIDKIIYHDNSRDKEPHIKMFLRPTDWSTWQCIQHLFENHNEKAKTYEDHQRAIEQHYTANDNLKG